MARQRKTVHDSFQNLQAKLGLGADNLVSQGSYAFNPISRDRTKLENAYRSSWIVRQAVDVIPEDMTRAGVDLQADIDPDHADQIQRTLRSLRVWQSLTQGLKWSRLYGGAVAVLLIDGQKLDTPLRVETVGKGQFRGMVVFDRWMLTPSSRLVTEYGPSLGSPESYTLTVTNAALPAGDIHHSRLIRFDGDDLPFWQRQSENGWGLSVLESLYDRLIAFDSTTAGASQLVFKAHLRTLRMKDYRKAVATGGAAFDGVVKQLDAIRKYQSSEGVTIIDAEDELEMSSYTFSGLSDVLLQFGQQLSGALQIPLVRLFGQSPAGLNATGESDIRTYYDGIAQRQEDSLRHGVQVALDLAHRSELGKPPGDGFGFEFSPLWQMSDKEKGELATSVTASVSAAYNDGIVSQSVALKELRQSSRITGIWTNITDEDIDAAEQEPPSASDVLQSEGGNDVPDLQPDGSNAGPEAAKPKAGVPAGAES